MYWQHSQQVFSKKLLLFLTPLAGPTYRDCREGVNLGIVFILHRDITWLCDLRSRCFPFRNIKKKLFMSNSKEIYKWLLFLWHKCSQLWRIIEHTSIVWLTFCCARIFENSASIEDWSSTALSPKLLKRRWIQDCALCLTFQHELVSKNIRALYQGLAFKRK